MRWQLIKDAAGRPGAENMALDQALLDEANHTGHAFLRLYRFAPPCLSFGRNEPTAHYDGAAIARLGLDVVRRPTGGRAVWHEHELTYSVAAPIAMFGRLRDAYRAIHARLVAALRTLGVEATLAAHRPTALPPDRRSACFASAVGGEVLVGGRKLIGSAQVRNGVVFLQHGSVLLDGSQAIVAAVSRQSSVVSHETTLAKVLGRRVSFDEVANAIIATWGSELTSTHLHQPPPTSTTFLADLARSVAPVKA